MTAARIWTHILFGFTNDIDLTTADYRFYGEANDDHAGSSVGSAGDVDGDGLAGVLIGARYNNNGGSDAGAAYIITGESLELDTDFYLTDSPYIIIGARNDDQLGNATTGSLGDVNGDGLADLLVGARYNDDWSTNSGAAYLFMGGTLPTPPVSIRAYDGDFSFSCNDDHCEAGTSVSGAGDVDGDGLQDLIIGNSHDDIGGTDRGSAHLILGQSLVQGGHDVALQYVEYVWGADQDDAMLGKSVGSAGDVDGDGRDDLLIGVPELDSNGDRSGSAYLIYGDNLDISLDDAQRFDGEFEYDLAGLSVTTAGDVDGDGLDDLIVGAPYNGESATYGGQVYLILASSLDKNGGDLDNIANLEEADFRFLAESSYDNAGWSVNPAGDVDDDGLADVIIGAPYDDDNGFNSGAAYLILGASLTEPGDFDLAEADYKFVGEDAWDLAGYSVSGMGDVDGDGRDDLLIGANGADDVGIAYLILADELPVGGGEVALVGAHFTFTGEASGDLFSEILAFTGDVNGDGFDDVIMGAPGNDEAGTDAGKCYFISGTEMLEPGNMDVADATLQFTGRNEYDNACASLSRVNDIDGDGLDDVIFGAPGNDEWRGEAGKAYLFFGSNLRLLEGTMSIAGEGMDRPYDFGFVGDDPSNYIGSALGAGDFNGDGFSDITMGAYGYNSERGRAYIKITEGY